MNTLAHLYLSGDDPDLLLGNFIGDSVRGDDFLQLEYRVQQGVLLHRKIDRFTDQHVIFKHICSIMRDGFGRYAPVVADVFLDHFLARDWERFNTYSLKEYVQWAQGLLAPRIEGCPERSRRYFHYLSTTNTLVHYQSIEGICSTLLQMSKRTRFKSGMENAKPVLTSCYEELEENFEIFFPEVVEFASASISDLTAPIQKLTKFSNPSQLTYPHIYK